MKQLLEILKEKFSKERFSIGLDIGTSTIKLVKLKFVKDTVELCNFNLEPIRTEAVQTLKTMIQSQEIKMVNISVSGPATIIRYINFPQMNDDELKQAFKFEAQKHIPFSVNDVNLDGYTLKQDLSDNKMLVLLAAVKKEFINQRLKLIQDAALKVGVIDVDSIALINAFNFNYSQDDSLKGKTIALVNMGASLTNLNILESGIPRLSRDIQIAGNSFTQKLIDILGGDFKSAEEIKLKPDKEIVNKVILAVESMLSILASEIRTSFDYYESQCASSVVKIFLSGGSSLFTGLKDLLANLLGIEVEFWDPLKQITISDSIDSQKINALSRQIVIAVGLALHK